MKMISLENAKKHDPNPEWLKARARARTKPLRSIHEDALHKIAKLDYSRAATNCCAFNAVKIAKEALRADSAPKQGRLL